MNEPQDCLALASLLRVPSIQSKGSFMIFVLEIGHKAQRISAARIPSKDKAKNGSKDLSVKDQVA